MTDSLLDDLRLLADGWRWSRRGIRPDVPRGSLVRDPTPTVVTTDWARTPLVAALRGLGQAVALPLLLRSTLEISVNSADRLAQLHPPVVFVANHASHLDAPLVLHALPPAWRRRIAIAAAADYFFTGWWRSTLAALAFNAVPLDRRSRDGAPRHLARLLADGWSVLAFPEGTRSRDGALQRFHHGVARLALEAHVPVVLVGVRGTFWAMPVGARWPGRGQTTVSVRFGPPVMPLPAERVLDLTARVRSAVEMVLEEDATTWWAAIRQSSAVAPRLPPRSRWRRVWQATSPVHPPRAPSIWRR